MKQRMRLGLSAVLAVMMGAACSYSKVRIVQTEGGQLEAVSASDKATDATLAAIDQAKDYCQKKGKDAIFTEERDFFAKPEDKAEAVIRKIPGVEDILGPGQSQAALAFHCS